MPIPDCAPELSPDFDHSLRELGSAWARDPARPSILEATLVAWDRLLDEWIASPELPLLIRKFRDNRGWIVRSSYGRELVPTDNSPAQWVFAVAYDGYCPELREVRDLLVTGKIPIAMAIGAIERTGATFAGIRNRCPSTSAAGWKLAHIEGVALGGRGTLDQYSQSTLENHFRRFLSPRNMFVVPAALAGLAEVDAFVEGFLAATGAPAAT